MAEHQVLFCPFCRESFEGLRTCPDHDLTLVPFDRLPPDPLEQDDVAGPQDDELLATFDMRLGRGYVALGAVATGAAVLLDFAHFRGGSLSTLAVAAQLPALYTPALVAFTLLFVLHRRRTPRAMRSLRVLVPALSLVAPLTLLWELRRVREGATFWGPVVDLRAGSAVYVCFLAAVFIGYGGAKLGVTRPTTRP